MAEGIKIVSVRRGVDPRQFALVAFGGAAGLHITEVARLLEIRRVVVPSVAALLSAWGMLATDLRYELVRSHVSEVGRMTAAGLRRLFAGLEREGRKRLARFDGPISVRRGLDMRYGEQIFEIQVRPRRRRPRGERPARSGGGALPPPARRALRLQRVGPGGRHRQRARRRRRARSRCCRPAPARAERGASRPAARRRVWLGDWVEVPVHRMDALASGPGDQGPGDLRVGHDHGAGPRR